MSAGGLLAGCQTTTSNTEGPSTVPAPTPDVTDAVNDGRPVFDAGKALLPEDTQDLRIAEVEVKLASDFTRTARNNGVSNAFILQEMQKAIPGGLRAANPNARFPVRAVVEVTRFSFANVAAGVLVGTKGSVANFSTTMFYTDTGAQVGRPAVASATTPPRPTLIGVAAIKPPPEEVKLVASRSSTAIVTRIFGQR